MPFMEAAGDAWRINKARPASQFQGTEPVSGLGHWRLYAAEQPVAADPPDAFRSTPQELLTYLKEQQVVLWIDCLHDDRLVRGAARPGAARRVSAFQKSQVPSIAAAVIASLAGWIIDAAVAPFLGLGGRILVGFVISTFIFFYARTWLVKLRDGL